MSPLFVDFRNLVVETLLANVSDDLGSRIIET